MQDWVDIDFAIQMGVDFIAVSFVKTADVINNLKSYLSSRSGKVIEIVAKIESHDSVPNAQDIIEASDAIMIARGDLGTHFFFLCFFSPISDYSCICGHVVPCRFPIAPGWPWFSAEASVVIAHWRSLFFPFPFGCPPTSMPPSWWKFPSPMEWLLNVHVVD